MPLAAQCCGGRLELYFTIIVSILFSLWAQQSRIFSAQDPKPVSICPILVVSCPDRVDQHEVMVCSATVSGGPDRSNISFRWKVSKGKITKGQETASIEIDIKNLFPAEVEATAEAIGEWPSSCPRQATATSVLVVSDPGPELFDKYGDIQFEEEKQYLHRLALLLEKDPGSQPYIIVYAGRRAYPNEAAERGERAKAFLVENYGIEAARVAVVDGGYRETRFSELWLVPPGAEAPVPTPTIDAKAVQMIKGKRPERKN